MLLSVLHVAVVSAAVLPFDERAQPVLARARTQVLQQAEEAELPSASPSAGPVTCRGPVCRQWRLVRNPAQSSCGQSSTWIVRTTARATTYGCVRRSVAESTY